MITIRYCKECEIETEDRQCFVCGKFLPVLRVGSHKDYLRHGIVISDMIAYDNSHSGVDKSAKSPDSESGNSRFEP